MIKKITFFLCFLVSTATYSQVGIGTTMPNNDSELDISSTTKGVLISRVSLTGTNNPNPLNNNVAGMVVYNISTAGSGNTAVFNGFYYNDGNQWIRLEPLSTAIGDVKQSLLTEDHNGWYRLDGRNVSTLPTKVQTNAASIGFGTILPNATDKFLKGKSATESLMDSGGNNAITLTQSNLPNVAFNGTANSAGNHTHDYDDKYHGVPENLNVVTGLLSILSGLVLNIMNNIVGKDTVSTSISTSTSNGSHSHTATINTGGSAVPLNPVSHLIAVTFVYLGN